MREYELKEVRPGRFAKVRDGKVVGIASEREVEYYKYHTRFRLVYWLRKTMGRLRGRRRAEIVKKARERVKLFKELETLDVETKQCLLPRIRHHEIRLAVIDTWREKAFMCIWLSPWLSRRT